jgi:hypothetical protein
VWPISDSVAPAPVAVEELERLGMTHSEKYLLSTKNRMVEKPLGQWLGQWLIKVIHFYFYFVDAPHMRRRITPHCCFQRKPGALGAE